MSEPQSKRSALLLIDMQVGLYSGPIALHRREQLLSNINTLTKKARAQGVPIFWARHTGPAGSPIAEGSVPWQLVPEVLVDNTLDIVFNKTRPSCFFQTSLETQLRNRGIGHLVIAGMKTQFCVDTTCRVASELGFTSTLVSDAHTTTEDGVIAAAQIVDHHNATLGAGFAKLSATTDVTW